ncbi:MAG: DNA repair exonuclease [Nanoarchaeota archaeon]|nr:DNA repair exonuclease [Nanoarchaeota archaeon]
MKFAHFADCHIGGWRDDKLKELGIQSFEKAIDICIEENTAFVLISGDLFNSALPNIDVIKKVANALNRLKEHNIHVYSIAGSHDYSVSGKTMLDVLENAGLIENVAKFDNGLKFTLDKTGTKIAGIMGLRGSLEGSYYDDLNREELERESGFKIFMFHTTINEFKPKEFEKIEGIGVSKLPKGFHYYAGGHVHYIFEGEYDKGKLVYPGALFPNNFAELEKYKHGGFYIVDDQLNLKYVKINLKDVESYDINADGKNIENVEREILKIRNFEDKILLLRVSGCLKEGRVSDINFKKLLERFDGAYAVLRNTSKLTSREFEEFNLEEDENVEETVVKKHLENLEFKEELVFSLMDVLSKEKHEGEKNIDFEKRLLKDIFEILK